MDITNTSAVILLMGAFIVFMVLIFLVIIVKAMSRILGKFSKDSKIKKEKRNFFDKQVIIKPQNAKKEVDIDNSTIAAISAAVSYNYLNSNKKYKICSIKRIFYADNRSIF